MIDHLDVQVFRVGPGSRPHDDRSSFSTRCTKRLGVAFSADFAVDASRFGDLSRKDGPPHRDDLRGVNGLYVSEHRTRHAAPLPLMIETPKGTPV